MATVRKERIKGQGADRRSAIASSDSESEDNDMAFQAKPCKAHKRKHSFTAFTEVHRQGENQHENKRRRARLLSLEVGPDRTSKCATTREPIPNSQSSISTITSRERTQAGTSVSSSEESPCNEETSGGESDEGGNTDVDAQPDCDEESGSDTNSGSDEKTSRSTALAGKKATLSSCQPSSLGGMIKRRKLELQNRSFPRVSPAHISGLSAECVRPLNSATKISSDELSDSDVVGSESSEASESDVDSHIFRPVVKKRRNSSLPSPPILQAPARKFHYRPIDPTPTSSTFKSLFRQPESSQSSQERKRPRAEPISKPGCVYILHDSETNHVKIGISRSVKTRHKALKGRCRKPDLTLEWNTGDNIPWAQLQRLEKIVHWDLNQFNKRYKCECGATHTEWFDVEIREARRTVEMWLRYQRMRPDVTSKEVERLKIGFPVEEGPTWLDVWTTEHVKRYEFWHWKLFGEGFDEAFCEE